MDDARAYVRVEMSAGLYEKLGIAAFAVKDCLVR